MIAQALSMIFPIEITSGVSSSRRAPVYAQETVREFFARISDELLWPRILVRHAPPPDEVQPIAPDRF